MTQKTTSVDDLINKVLTLGIDKVKLEVENKALKHENDILHQIINNMQLTK